VPEVYSSSASTPVAACMSVEAGDGVAEVLVLEVVQESGVGAVLP
jgi:hypothetical protein